MFHSSVDDCQWVDLPGIQDARGNLTFIERSSPLKFNIARVYYLHDVPKGSSRGGHAHKNLTQLLIAVSGAFDLILDDGTNKSRRRLDDANRGVTIVPGIWRELENFEENTVCLVLASHVYDENDYIRDYNEFLLVKNQ